MASVRSVEADFGPGRQHAIPQPGPDIKNFQPFRFIAIFEREDGYSDEHGAQRFAILFMAVDGFAAFDALFCQGNGIPAPFCVVLQDHGFGGNHDRFGRGGVLERLAIESQAQPRFALAEETQTPIPVWDGYQPCPCDGELMGMHRNLRHLYER